MRVRWLLLAAVLGCGDGPRNAGEDCTYQYEAATHDCGSRLYCNHQDSCTTECPGTCVKLCGTDADCSLPQKCTGTTSPQQGRRNYCVTPSG